MNLFTNKSLLYFLGGIAVGAFGTKVLKSEKFRQICLLGLAKGLQYKDELGTFFEEIQENAKDFLAEAESLAGTSSAENANSATAETPAPAEAVTGQVAPATTPRKRRAAGTRKPRAKKAE